MTPFDRNAALAALRNVPLAMCRRDGGPTGRGMAMVTFHPSGGVYNVELLDGAFTGTLVGGCIIAQYESIRVPKFGGSLVTLARSFSLD